MMAKKGRPSVKRLIIIALITLLVGGGALGAFYFMEIYWGEPEPPPPPPPPEPVVEVEEDPEPEPDPEPEEEEPEPVEEEIDDTEELEEEVLELFAYPERRPIPKNPFAPFAVEAKEEEEVIAPVDDDELDPEEELPLPPEEEVEEEPPPQPQLVLKGVVGWEGKRKAVLEGYEDAFIVGQGDEIMGWRVESIQREWLVLVDKEEEEWEYKLLLGGEGE